MGLRLLLAVTVWCTAQGCAVEQPSGTELLGRFTFTGKEAGPAFTDCTGIDLPKSGFTFEATVTARPDAGKVWLVMGNGSRDASLDGGVLTSFASALQPFANCGCAEILVEETMTFALLSASQAAAAGPGCPVNPLDGGVPAPDGDAGILAPGPTAAGYDAVRACGELVDVLKPATSCTCSACSIRYKIEGERL